MFHKHLKKAVWLSAALAVLPLAAKAQPSDIPPPIAVGPTVETAKLKVGVEILENLKVFDVMVAAANRHIINDPEVPVNDKSLVIGYLREELLAAKGGWLSRVAAECVSATDAEQLQLMLKLSKTRYLQAMLAAGADPNLPQPDFNKASPDEQALIGTQASAQAVTAFFSRFNKDMLLSGIMPAATKANQRYLQHKQGK